MRHLIFLALMLLVFVLLQSFAGTVLVAAILSAIGLAWLGWQCLRILFAPLPSGD